MKSPAHLLRARVAASLLVFTLSVSQAQVSVSDIPGMDGNMLGQATGLNSSGTVIGFVGGNPSPLSSITGSAVAYSNGVLTSLGTLGGANSYAYGINDAGQIVGQADTADGSSHAFLYDGTMHDLGTAGGTSSAAFSINASGQIVGSINHADGSSGIMLYNSGTMQDLGTAGGAWAFGRHINHAGQVSGSVSMPDGTSQVAYYSSAGGLQLISAPIAGASLYEVGLNNSGQLLAWESSPGDQHALIYQNGVLQQDVAGIYPVAINNAGQVAGILDNRSLAVYSGGTLQNLGDLGFDGGAIPVAMNEAGWVTGALDQFVPDQSTFAETAFLYIPGVGIVDLNAYLPTGTTIKLTRGILINDNGDLVANGVDTLTGDGHVYELSGIKAIPEPSTYAFLSLGMLGWAAAARRARG